MLPRWFCALLALQLAAAIALGFVAVRMLSGGVRDTAAAVTRWAHTSPGAPPSWPALPVPRASASAPPRSPASGFTPELLRRLNRDTATTATGEYALLLQLESVIGQQILRILNGSARAR